MIDFRPTSEQEQMRALARRFAIDHVAPVAAQHDRFETYPEAVVAKAAELGLLNLRVPADCGGVGLGVLDEVLVGEEIAWGCMGTYTILMASDLGVTPVLLFGTEAQRRRFLAPLTDGTPRLAAFALSEPDNGSDAAAMRTRAVEDGDALVLHGTKMWISNGALADYTVVFASARPGGGAPASLAVVVPRDADGLSWRKIDGKLGQRASPTYEMVLDGVRVPRDNLLGDVGEGMRIALATLDQTRIPVAAGAIGVARRARDEAARYANQRTAFGKPIASFQAVAFKLAEMEIGLRTARAMTWEAAWRADAGLSCGHEAAIAKAYASDMAFRSASEAVNVLGGYGYVDEFPVGKLMRDVKLNQIYEGTNEIQRLVISRKVTRDADLT
ncbi:MAG: acyl-CoA dehydrogenase family protein [Trueperaceae bacterium]|nr:acyl-CoA dehydrogenase family protein [Trueperaceae bacterium]